MNALADDVSAVRALARGDDAALGALYDRYSRPCYAFAIRMLGSEGDAEEVVQETFLRAWRNAGAYDPARASVSSWLLAITRNLCIDELRRRRRNLPAAPLDDAVPLPASERTEAAAELALDRERVRTALASLPGEQRSAIELVYYHGLTSTEVGRILGVPSPTVRSRLRLGLLKLAGILRPGELRS
ncbi:sigma-70 family RNA polymerase sigma factor [Tepidiforma flava]|uniref:RNA polymerase sigma factor n=1 Tax=Tepidiforma flava TaxID=3004094 RepID=A0ABY7M9U4_9CHLR|nr:sigma-70 family RNA polymerase sigma factor [Tepidiforma flava]WBL36865.1 sigma-70 family RNA polymerase sigma factor [Tepidiforma flava]